MDEFLHKIVEVKEAHRSLPPVGTQGWVSRLVKISGRTQVEVIFNYSSPSGSDRTIVKLYSKQVKRHLAVSKTAPYYPFIRGSMAFLWD